MVLHYLYEALLALSWLIALNWVWRVLVALRNLPHVPDLLDPRYDALESEGSQNFASNPSPGICVIVPACNEESSISATLQSLLASEGVPVEIIAADDRSADSTGEFMDAMAEAVAESGARESTLRVLHVTDLPAGWLGKPHAMALAARHTHAEWLLFTDGDVLFDPDTLRRALRYMADERADHLVVYPTLILKSFGERMMVACFHVLSIWIVRPWKVADPKALKDTIGTGAFSMVRREVYTAVGGYESLRMEVLDDVRLGYKIKRAGYRQRVAFGRDLVRIRWAVGAAGVVRNMTKNAFAAFGFRVAPLIAACCGLALLTLLPLALPPAVLLSRIGSGAGLHPGSLPWWPAIVEFAALWLMARYYRRHTGISPAYLITFPVGASIFIYAILRSMALTLAQGGVRWRGTFYPLAQLRKHAGPVR